MRFITGDDYTSTVQNVLSNGQETRCAIAFWGHEWINYFDGLIQPIQIICNLESGATNPSIIEKFRHKKNIELRTHCRLHSKVVLSGNNAIIGSANASANGLSLEDSELRGWIEAGVMTQNPEIIADADQWFNRLWGDAIDVKQMDSSKLNMIIESWKDRRRRRHPDLMSPEVSILAKLKNDPEWFKDSNILIVITRDSASMEAEKTFHRILPKIEEQDNADFYEDFTELPSDHFIVDLYYGPRKGFEFTGLFKTPDPPIISKFRYEDGGQGTITLCSKVKSIQGMIVSNEDERLLKQRIEELWQAKHPSEDESGTFIDVYSAREILFPE